MYNRLDKRLELVENTLFKITCPNCGANMKLDRGSVFECPYCKTSLYVCPAGNIEMRAISFRNRKDDPEELKEIIAEQIDNHAAEMLAKDLINNREYCKKTITDDVADYNNETRIINYVVRFIKWEDKDNV